MKEPREIEINITNLFFYILRRWKSILLAALIGMMMLGGWKYMSVARSNNATGEIAGSVDNSTGTQDVVSEMEKQLQLERHNQQINELEIERQSDLIEQLDTYLHESVLMQINPYDKPEAENSYIVSVNAESYDSFYDPADPIVTAYNLSVANSSEIIDVSQKYGIDVSYIKELIRSHPDLDANTIVLTATGSSPEMAQDILRAVETAMLSHKDEISERYGVHEISKISEDQSMTADYWLLKIQTETHTSLTAARNTLSEAQKALADSTSKIQSLEASLAAQDSQQTAAIFRDSIRKYFILGFLLGGFMAMGWYLLYYILQHRIRTEDEVKNGWKIPVLGVFDKTSQEKIFKSLDEWLLKLEGVKTGITDETVIDNTVVSLENVTTSGSKLLITGCAASDKYVKCVEMLKTAMKDKDVTLLDAPDILHSASQRKLLAECDGVLLIEERDVTQHKEFREKLDTIRIFDKKIIGCVLY